jgi:hypothetical protein
MIITKLPFYFKALRIARNRQSYKIMLFHRLTDHAHDYYKTIFRQKKDLQFNPREHPRP